MKKERTIQIFMMISNLELSRNINLKCFSFFRLNMLKSVTVSLCITPPILINILKHLKNPNIYTNRGCHFVKKPFQMDL